MHIVLVSQEYPPARHGGIGAQNRIKADGLITRGHSVTVITHSTTQQREECTSGDLRIIRLPGYDDRLPIHAETARWLTHSVHVAEALAKLQSLEPIDLIDFAEWGAEGYTFFLNRTEFNYIPAVVQLHGPLVMFANTMDWPEKDSLFFRVGTHMESICVQFADAVYSSSQCSIDWCVKHYGLNALDIPILHTGVDLNVFCPYQVAKESRPTVVFVGKLVENKGVIELAEAAEKLLDEFPEIQVWLIGGGEASVIEKLKAIKQRALRSDFLQLRGFVARDQLPEILSRAHVFAAPSVYEGGPGFVYLEAMGCGLPVIACSGSGAAEVVRAGENGLLVPPQEVDALMAALRQLIVDEPRRAAMGQRGREFVVTEADSQICLDNLVNFYQSVVSAPGGRKLAC